MSWSFSRRGGYSQRVDKTVRSNYEATLKTHLERDKIPYEYEKSRIRYSTEHYYKPDFTLQNGIHVEAKGLFLPADRKKHLEIQKQNPNIEIRFIFQRDQKINKGSKTKYSDWCKKHNFVYHIGDSIPKEWSEEKF